MHQGKVLLILHPRTTGKIVRGVELCSGGVTAYRRFDVALPTFNHLFVTPIVNGHIYTRFCVYFFVHLQKLLTTHSFQSAMHS